MFFLIGEPLLNRIGPVAAASLSAGAATSLDRHGRHRGGSCHGADRAIARIDLRAVASDLHAGVDADVPRNLAATAQAIYGTIGVGLATSALTCCPARFIRSLPRTLFGSWPAWPAGAATHAGPSAA